VASYCERLQDGFWAEPLNVLTGLSFLIVGLVVVRLGPDGDDRRAGAGLSLVGITSVLNHGFAVDATLWANMVANLAFLVLLGVLMLRRLAQTGAVAGWAGALALVGLGYVAGQDAVLADRLGLASDMFVMLLLVLIAVALGLRNRQRQVSGRIALAAAVLALGLPFRFLDQALCAGWSLGTHWIWHLMNAASIAILLWALALHRRVA
jgi:hypothetical protein